MWNPKQSRGVVVQSHTRVTSPWTAAPHDDDDTDHDGRRGRVPDLGQNSRFPDGAILPTEYRFLNWRNTVLCFQRKISTTNKLYTRRRNKLSVCNLTLVNVQSVFFGTVSSALYVIFCKDDRMTIGSVAEVFIYKWAYAKVAVYSTYCHVLVCFYHVALTRSHYVACRKHLNVCHCLLAKTQIWILTYIIGFQDSWLKLKQPR